MVHTLRVVLDSMLLSKNCSLNFRSCIHLSSIFQFDTNEDRTPKRSREIHSFLDSLRIHAKGGSGGAGLPSKGGLGGNGGDVVVVGSTKPRFSLKMVLKSCPKKRYTAEPGINSKFFCLFGERGKSVTVSVPLGISVISEAGHKLGEINEPGDKVVIAQGGEGGSPHNGFSGQAGQSHSVTLDLKLIADVGFVGFPNAGKSTLLRAIARAKPRIASYPFTTVRPNVGIIEYHDERTISLADLPGLIEGAHANMGMGHKFLKHVERTKLLMFVVDLHSFQLGPRYNKRSALETIVILNKELELYQEDLTLKPAMLVLNKTDLPGSYSKFEQIRDTLFDEKHYRDYVDTLPEEFRPNHLIRFDDIVPISAAKDPSSVLILQEKLRNNIDVNTDIDKIERSSEGYLQAFPLPTYHK